MILHCYPLATTYRVIRELKDSESLEFDNQEECPPGKGKLSTFPYATKMIKILSPTSYAASGKTDINKGQKENKS